MPAPKRRAPRRTAAAVAEDLSLARWTGGFDRANESDLSATMDWLSVVTTTPDDASVFRARDLLVHYTNRVCDAYTESEEYNRTDIVAAHSLRRLLLRSRSNTKLAEVIRREAAATAGHNASPDTVRHREDKLIAEIASQAATDLDGRHAGRPRTVEAATHRLAPLVADARQDLHDLLCVTYAHVPSRSPREERVIDSYHRGMVIQLGKLLVASADLVEVGLQSGKLQRRELALISFARKFLSMLFDEGDDQSYMLEFMRSDTASSTLQQASDLLRASERGEALYSRWIAWVRYCYPTCAFERTTEEAFMCQPHAFLTSLYDFEARYLRMGYSHLGIPGNEPIRHHNLTPWSDS